MSDVASKRARFRALHREGCFVLPNPWDRGSARLLEHLGFAALASTSSGFAWTTGHADLSLSKNDVLQHLSLLCASVDLPINADFESGFASEPQDVAANVTLAIATGVAGLSIEDKKADGAGLYDLPFAVERIRVARAAIDRSGADVILVARTEGPLEEPAALKSAMDKLAAFAAAGADCLYAPGLKRKQDIAALVRAVAPKPVNVLMTAPGYRLEELAELGVRRVSVGGALARVAWGAVLAAAEQFKTGSFEGLAGAASGQELNRIFEGFGS